MHKANDIYIYIFAMNFDIGVISLENPSYFERVFNLAKRQECKSILCVLVLHPRMKTISCVSYCIHPDMMILNVFINPVSYTRSHFVQQNSFSHISTLINSANLLGELSSFFFK